MKKSVKVHEHKNTDMHSSACSVFLSERSCSEEPTFLEETRTRKEEDSESEISWLTDTESETHPSCDDEFEPRSKFGGKLQSWFGKLWKSIQCFSRVSSTSSSTNDAVVETTMLPALVVTEPASAEDEKTSSHDNHIVRDEIVQEEDEEDTSYEVDQTPRRFKCNVGMEADLSVIEKGMVVRTLEKLRATGCSVFTKWGTCVSDDTSRKNAELLGGNYFWLPCSCKEFCVRIPRNQLDAFQGRRKPSGRQPGFY